MDHSLRSRASYIHVHIPKAGGRAFFHNAPMYLPVGARVRGTGEKGVLSTKQGRAKLGAHSKLTVLLRNPLHLIYSQFIYCKHVLRRGDNDFPRKPGRGVAAGLQTWAQNFMITPAPTHYRCYDPTNIQTRFVSTDSGANEPSSTYPGVTRARYMLDRSFALVGIMELFNESMCLLRYEAAKERPPAYCACGASRASAPMPWRILKRETPKHPISGLAQSYRRMLASLVQDDLLLYLHGLHWFERAVGRVRDQTGVLIACPNRLEAVWKDALELVCTSHRLGAEVDQLIARLYSRHCPGRRKA